VIAATDPLNLVGIVTAGVRVAAMQGNRVLLLNGQPIGVREAGTIRWFVDLEENVRHRATRLLTAPGGLRHERFATAKHLQLTAAFNTNGE